MRKRNTTIISGEKVLIKCPFTKSSKRSEAHFCLCVEEIAKIPNITPEAIFDEFGNYAFCLSGLKSVMVEDGVPFYSQAKVARYRRHYLSGVKLRVGQDFQNYRFAMAKTIVFYDLYDNIYGLLPGAMTKDQNEMIVRDMAQKEDNALVKLKISCADGDEDGDDAHIPSITKPFERIVMSSYAPPPKPRMHLDAPQSSSQAPPQPSQEPICMSFDIGETIIPLQVQDITFNVSVSECVLKFEPKEFKVFIDSLKRVRGESAEREVKRVRT